MHEHKRLSAKLDSEVARLVGPMRMFASLLLVLMCDSVACADSGSSQTRYDTPAVAQIRTGRSGRPEPPIAGTPLKAALVGRWESETFVLTIDQDAVQANLDPSKPFQWDALHVLDATDRMIVFELGGDRFIALLTDEGMTLTQAGQPGHHHLVRKR